MKVLLFGGTSEGRELAGWLAARGMTELWVSSVTEYGSSLVSELDGVHVLTGAMKEPDIEAFIAEHEISCVIDATHPYAAHVSASIAQACEATHTPLERVLRKDEPLDGFGRICKDAAQAAAYLASKEGNILLTTGSKELGVYTHHIADYPERLYARVLPVDSSIRSCSDLGIPTNHIIAMQGPFSKDFNVALIREYSIATLVTKASGNAGGFEEKLEAARACGIELVIIARPEQGEGLELSELQQRLESAYGA